MADSQVQTNNDSYSRTILTTSGVQVKIEEDTTQDSETGHTSEVVTYLAIEGVVLS